MNRSWPSTFIRARAHQGSQQSAIRPDQWVCREASELPLVAPVNAEPHNTYVSSLLLLLRVFRDSTAHGPSPSHPSTRGTTGIPLSGPVEGSELDFLYASRKPIKPFVTAVTCAALHPVRRASCTSKIFLSMYWTCFSFRCTQKIRKKTRPTASWSSTIRVQVPGRFPCLGVFKVETGNLKSTIQQHLSFPCSRQGCTSQTPRSYSAFGDR